MSTLLLYLLKANLALLLFGAGYWLGLRRLTFYSLNRGFLLLAIGFAALCPLVPSTYFLHPAAALGGAYPAASGWVLLARPNPDLGWNYWLAVAYWTGVLAMLLRLAGQAGALWRLHRASVSAELGGQRFRRVAGLVSPFSFGRCIYLDPALHPAAELPAIIAHERVHVRQWHTLDVLLAQVQQAFYWFNPGAWLLRRAILENLEFITDRAVLRAGLLDRKAYQYSLVKLSTLAPGSALANHFTFLVLKNRIMMMNKPRSSSWQLAKYALLLPLAALTMALTASQPATHAPAPVLAPPLGSDQLYFLDGQPVSKAVVDQLAAASIESVNVLKGAAAQAFDRRAAAVVLIITTKKNKDSAAVKAFNQRVEAATAPAGLSPADKPLPLDQSPALAAGTLILVDGKATTEAEMKRLPATEIESVRVYKGEAAVKQFGDRGKAGVVEVTTKHPFKMVLPFGGGC